MAQEPDPDYQHVARDLEAGLPLLEVAERAYANAERYWEYVHGHPRDDHDHPEDRTPAHDGLDEVLSAGEAVEEIHRSALELEGRPGLDPLALDLVEVSLAVIDAWPDCGDTFEAVHRAVSKMPVRAAEVAERVAAKRDCNCTNGGLWLDWRVHERLRFEDRFAVLDVPVACSCSQVAMYGAVAALPENREFDPDADPDGQQPIVARMTERVQEITDRVAAAQSRDAWECGCTDINLAGSMQGIAEDELRDGVYQALAEKYTEDAADTGLVVDSFGIVGLYPVDHWGDASHATRENTLRRKAPVYRGDNLLLDPFDPAAEFTPHGERNFGHLRQHRHETPNIPTDLFISEYIEGWNAEALAMPETERDPADRNRSLELYNGTRREIDLGAAQYILEIYGTGAEPQPRAQAVAFPARTVRQTISLAADVTFDFDRSEIRPQASRTLDELITSMNDTDIFSEVLVTGHTCDIGTDEYNQGLSERRANSVRRYLEQHGLEVSAVRAEGKGELEPRLPNTSQGNRSLNRRVDITFVTREGVAVEETIIAGEGGQPDRYVYTFTQPEEQAAAAAAVTAPAQPAAAPGQFIEGEREPRQVIGLNGVIEPGETFVVTYDESDEALIEAADLVTGQLDYLPNETLVIRRFGGEMALHCRAHAYAFVANFPPLPWIRPPFPGPVNPPPPPDRASPD